ncbi:hypothetical protein SLS58_008673 [Diplodia intermedia]|uniref:Uncharacterized protein n=1 Tax=Diplodia intermedia TaxID=856260 RepID=A0ABR3TGV0_9PEZI
MATDDYDSLYQQHFDLQGRRGEIIDTRFDLIGQRSALQDHISTFQQAAEELIAQVKALSTDDQTLLSPAIASIQLSRDSLSQQLGQTQELEKRLNKLEYKFGKEENEFFGSLRAALPALVKAAQVPTASPSPAANLTPSEALEEIRKTTLQAFYDKSSDVPILEERLVELDHTFDSERGHRETRTTLGQPILPPDLEFYTQYHQDRESLQAELAQTRSQVNRLQARCVQLGLIPPPPTPPNINEDIAGVSKQVPPKARSWMHSSESGKDLEYSFVSDGHQMPKLPNFANPRDRINQWITEARDTAEPPDAPGSGNSSNGQHPQGASGSEANNDSPVGAASPSESQENVDESQLRQKRSMSQFSEVLEPSHSDEQPPQKSPKPS